MEMKEETRVPKGFQQIDKNPVNRQQSDPPSLPVRGKTHSLIQPLILNFQTPQLGLGTFLLCELSSGRSFVKATFHPTSYKACVPGRQATGAVSFRNSIPGSNSRQKGAGGRAQSPRLQRCSVSSPSVLRIRHEFTAAPTHLGCGESPNFAPLPTPTENEGQKSVHLLLLVLLNIHEIQNGTVT